MASTVGGAAKVVFYALTDTGSAYTIGASAAWEGIGRIVKTGFAKDSKGGVKITWDQFHNDSTFDTFIDTYAVAQNSTEGGETLVDELGVEYNSVDSSAPTGLLLAISYGAVQGSNRLVTISIGTISPESGSFDQEGKKFAKPTLIFNGIKSAYALTIPEAKLDAALVNPVTDPSYPINTYIKKFWLPKV